MRNLLKKGLYTAVLGFLCACSAESDFFIDKGFHNLTAHYNSYYYSAEEIAGIESTIAQARTDNYNDVLRLFPSTDSVLAKSYNDKLQEAVKMASISIQRHPNSKWVDDAYLLVGKARLYSLDWGNAIQTFKYINSNSKDEETRHHAVIWLIRTFTEHQEYNNAQAAIDYLDKQKLSRVNQKRLYLEKAHFYQVQDNYDRMVNNLVAVDTLLTRKDKPGRIYFIIAQVYQQLGLEASAYFYYRKCLATNPEYEIDFYARLYQAQVTEISRSKDINTARKSFRKLLKDPKNKEFRDKIYYELALFELKQDNTDEAITNLNLAVRESKNPQIKGEAYLELGKIYYEKERKYELSEKYYDSAIVSLPQSYEGYAAIKERQEILTRFVQHQQTIQWQDSLLTMATWDSAALIGAIENYVASITPPEPDKRNKRKANRVTIETVTQSNSPGTFSGSSEWYFGNAASVAAGKLEFQRIWGNLELQDNWRRGQRAVPGIREAELARNQQQTQAQDAPGEEVVVDPVEAEYQRIASQIPYSEAQKKESLKKIEDAYFVIGDIYNFDFKEPENAVETYTTLLTRFPESEYTPEVLYKLYLLLKEIDPVRSDQYATRLKQSFPNTTYARVLENPDYLKESSATAEKQKSMYDSAYRLYTQNNFQFAKQVLSSALQLGDSYFVPRLKLLSMLITGATEDITLYQYNLDQFIKEFPDTEEAAYANRLLSASRNVQLQMERSRGINYIASFDEPHLFVVVSRTADQLSDRFTLILDRFNRSFYPNTNINTSTISFDNERALTFVTEFKGLEAAKSYFAEVGKFFAGQAELRNSKFDKFVITQDNFNILYRTKGLNEYLRFFEQNYQTGSP